jgi:hypothetical protein
MINSEELELFIVESLTIAPNQRHIEGRSVYRLCFLAERISAAAARPRLTSRRASPDDLNAGLNLTCFAEHSHKAIRAGRVPRNGWRLANLHPTPGLL